MDAALPHELRAALEAMTEGRSTRDLAERAQAISAAYRSGAPSSQIIRTEADALAYALTRMPATYAAVRAALEALAERAPDFAPETLTDVGCGPGTASWAAFDAFPDLTEARLVDHSRPLLDLAISLMDETSVAARVESTLAPLASAALPPAAMVLAAYVLTELSEAIAVEASQRLWTATEGVLVIVEPGTPAGWARLMAIRPILIDMGGKVLAPCPHHEACPVIAPDWCHFSQRLPRSRAHRLLKDADAPFEDEKYAYLVVARPGVAALPSRAARVLAAPVEDKAAVSLKLCEPSGALELRRIAKRDKESYRAIRRAGWGDLVE
jgi:ribosomal protein RSM22 (predicted rRNA methylase)